MVEISEKNQDKIVDTILKHVKGFSMLLSIVGAILIVISVFDDDKWPKGLFGGISLIAISSIYLISETIIKVVKIKNQNKNKKDKA